MPDIAEITTITGTKFCTSSELERLTEAYPLEQTLGVLYPLLKAGALMPKYGKHIFGNSPADNSDTEIFFGDMLNYAVKNGKWVGYNILWTPRKIEYVERNMDNPEEVSGEAVGMIKARNAGILKLEISDGTVYAVPTEEFIKFVQTRALGRHAIQSTPS